MRLLCTAASTTNATEEAPAIPRTTYLRAYEEYCEGRPEQALLLLDQVESSDPQYSLALALRGRVATMKGDYNAALHFFEQSLDVNDANSLTYYYKASVYDILKQRDEAIRALSECVDVDPDFAIARTELAGHLVAIGDFKGAIDHANYCLQTHPSMDQALYWKAKALFHLDRFQEARTILSLYDEYADTYAVRLGALAGEVELALGDVQKAKTFFVKAFKENPSNFPDEALCKLAKIYVDQGNNNEAARILRARLFEEEAARNAKLGQTSDTIDLLQKCYGNVLYQSGDMPAAIDAYEASITANPKQFEVHLELIRLNMELSYSDVALENIARAEKLFPTDLGLKKLKVIVLVDLHKNEEALTALEALEHEEPSEVQSLTPWRCVALAATGRRGEAESLFHQIKENSAFDPLGTITLARSALLLDHPESSIVIIKRLTQIPTMPLSALGMAAAFSLNVLRSASTANHILTHIAKKHPTNAFYLTQLARLRQMTGDTQFAMTIWQHLSKLVPGDARPWTSIGDIYTAQKKYLEALTQFKRAQDCEGPEEMIHEAKVKEGVTLLHLRRWDQAIDMLEKAVHGPQYTDSALKIYGAVLTGEAEQLYGIHVPEEYTELEQAVPLLKAALSDKIIQLGDRSPVHLLLTRTLLRLGRREEALAHFEKAKALNPNPDDLAFTQEFVDGPNP